MLPKQVELLTGFDLEGAQVILVGVVLVDFVLTERCVAVPFPTPAEIDLVVDAADAVAAANHKPKGIVLAIAGVGDLQFTKDRCEEGTGSTKTIDLPMLWHIKEKASAISLQCDRVTEMEHAADDAYEEYIGYIFSEEEDMREMTKYKNLAEIFEKATDSQKHVADCVRLMVLRFLHE